MGKAEQTTESLPSGPRFPADFWHAPTFEQLAESQGVKPVTNFESLLGGWPEDEIEDGFEDAVISWREEELHQDR